MLGAWKTRVQTMEFTSNGTSRIVVSFDNVDLQGNVSDYIHYIHSNGNCMSGGAGSTDIASALVTATTQFNRQNAIKKVISISACSDTTGAHLHFDGCDESNSNRSANIKQLYDQLGIDHYAINIPEPTTANPTTDPTNEPSQEPTYTPTSLPSFEPTDYPSDYPTDLPTDFPSDFPTHLPTSEPTTSDPTTAQPTVDPITIEQWISSSLFMPKSDRSMAAGHHQDMIYILGGQTISTSLMEYNITNNTFSYTASFSPVVSGYSQFYQQIGSNLYMTHSTAGRIHRFAMDTKQFTSDWATAPAIEDHPCFTGDDEFLYYLGGRTGPSMSVQILNIANISWSNGPNMIQGRYQFSCVTTLNNKLYSIGGLDGGFVSTVEYISTTNIHNNSWSYTPNNLSLALCHTRSVVHHKQIFVIGGDSANSEVTDKVHIIDTISNIITVSNATLAYRISMTACTIVNNKIYAFGGRPSTNKWQYLQLPSSTNTPSPTIDPTWNPNNKSNSSSLNETI